MVTLFVTFLFWKNLRSPRTVVLVNLCVAIAVTDVLIIAMETADIEKQVGFGKLLITDLFSITLSFKNAGNKLVCRPKAKTFTKLLKAQPAERLR